MSEDMLFELFFFSLLLLGAAWTCKELMKPRGKMKPLGERRRRFALLVIAMGIYTFFVPLIIVDPPVLNRTEWSALNIASTIYERKLPVPGGRFDVGLLQIALVYVLMLPALITLYLPGPPRALMVISTIGFAFSSFARFWSGTFYRTFGYYGHMQQWHMRGGRAWWIVPWIMPALVAICLTERSDA